jgi:cytochrome c2
MALLVALLDLDGTSARAADTEQLARGAAVWAKCQACHTLRPGGRHTVGPNLHAIIGQRAGTRPGYRYSDSLRAADVVWTPDTLDRFIADAQGFLPGAKMYGGLAVEADRADLLVWMRAVDDGRAPPPAR